jgi:hypothetical protein
MSRPTAPRPPALPLSRGDSPKVLQRIPAVASIYWRARAKMAERMPRWSVRCRAPAMTNICQSCSGPYYGRTTVQTKSSEPDLAVKAGRVDGCLFGVATPPASGRCNRQVNRSGSSVHISYTRLQYYLCSPVMVVSCRWSRVMQTLLTAWGAFTIGIFIGGWWATLPR